MMRGELVIFLLACLVLISSEARSIFPRPHTLSSLKINSTQNAGTCSFTVSIRTSCSSTSFTRDLISLAFGDAYGNQVYAARLDDPSSRALERTFERCSADTFRLHGPCTYQVCYLYIYRNGYDGWMPYDITVYGHNSNPVTFHYNVFVPSATWYGFNYCRRANHADSATA